MADDDVVTADPERGVREPLTGSAGDGTGVTQIGKVTFTSKSLTDGQTGKADEAAIDIAVAPGYMGQGLSKSEVMMYANDPMWKKVRMGSFLLFWLVWLGLLGAAVAIVMTGTCVAKDTKQ